MQKQNCKEQNFF